MAPDVGEDEPAHVRESRNLRTLIFGVVSPDESDKHLHDIDVFVVTSIRVVPCDWEIKMNLDPPFDGEPQHTLV